jgi:uncharacterized damage-inducible protein DinB
MTVSSAWLPEFEQEMKNTRRALERVPWGNADFRPHERSMSLGQLALHLVEIPSWVAVIFEKEELDLSSYAAPGPVGSTEELVQRFDAEVTRGREVLQGASEDSWLLPWTLRSGEHVIFTLPRMAVLRSLVFSHLIHHRGQLTVYFRLLGVPVPALYGPSADEA